MKIKTITCHDVYNVGASLQAYALPTYLQQVGHDVQVLNYKPDYLSGHHRLWGGASPKYDKPFVRTAYCIAKLPQRIIRRFGKRKREFDRFTRDFLPLSQTRYHFYQELLDDHNYADLYIAGSDQIWNTLFPNGKDPAFYLQFVPEGIKKASYAASFATKHIADGWEDQLARWIGSLNYVSVRERSGLDILEGLGIQDACQVLDPVFLLDRENWSDLSKEWQREDSRPYVIVYDFDSNPQIAEFAKQVADEHGWEVVSFLRNPYIAKNYSQEGPVAFLSLIRNAQAVVSNSFHATAFSLIFEKEFWVFDRKEGINTRMRDLAVLSGTDNRIIDGNTWLDHAPIDYALVHGRLDAAIRSSKAYLETVLGEDQ